MIDLLIVDDEEVVRTLFSRWAAADGYAVTEAQSISGALARITERVPALMLCDLSLPDGDGRNLAAQLTQSCPDTVVILMSGYRHTGDAAAGGTATISFLAKPFTRAQLTTALAEAVDIRLEHQAAAVRARIDSHSPPNVINRRVTVS